MVNLQELFPVADVVGLVVFDVGEDHQDAVGREVVHFAPEAGADEQPFGGRIEDDAFFGAAVEEAQANGAGYADAELAELLMRMEATADTRLRAMNPVDATDGKRERPAQFGDGKPTTRVAALGDVDELDERLAHRPWVMMVLR